jgi:hypothetical protein
VEDVPEIEIERAHRVGTKGTRPRPIVAMFSRHPDKVRVQKEANKLRDTPYGIADQFPKEIQERRKKLMPFLRDARKNGDYAVLAVDKLFINGQRFYPPTRTTE